jgi:hypothetical protein
MEEIDRRNSTPADLPNDIQRWAAERRAQQLTKVA